MESHCTQPTTSIKLELVNLRALLNESHDPLHRVPREIVSRIFVAFFEEYLRPKEMPFLLGAVCRLWRDIAWATPKIWTSALFILNPRNSEGDYITLFDEYIGRSGSLPIDIHINWREGHGLSPSDPDVPRLIDILKGCASRWNSLELYLHLYTFPSLLKGLPSIAHPTLRHLKLFPIGSEEDSYDDSFDEEDEAEGFENPRPQEWAAITRNLETLELDANCDVVILDDLKVDCSSLTRIVGRGTYDALSTFIRTSPRLTTAMLEIGTESLSGHTEVPFTHPMLRTLKLSPLSMKVFNDFLTLFVFPHLNALTIDTSDLSVTGFQPEIVASFLASSGENLRQINLENTRWTFEVLRGALVPLLQLEELSFNCPGNIYVPEIIKAVFGAWPSHSTDSPASPKASSRFPKLRTFRILSGSWNPADLWDCLQLIEEHCNNHFAKTSPPEFGEANISRSACLQLLEIRLSSKGQPPYMHQRFLEIVGRLEGMGVQINIARENRGEVVEDLVVTSRRLLALH